MRIGNLGGRATLVRAPGEALDLARASSNRFGPDPMQVWERWNEILAWAGSAPEGAWEPLQTSRLEAPVPAPRQVFALAVNYPTHAAEAGAGAPENPYVFTKFPSCIGGPTSDVLLSTNRADWEAELVVVIGHEALRVAESDAWSVVAGLTVGQDITERRLQFRKPIPHLSLSKSLPTFGPTGPLVVSPDEFADASDLLLTCSVNGEEMQHARTSEMFFSVRALVAEISHAVQLLPGDLIFTGTPSGVGSTRDPRRYLTPGDVIETSVEGIGTMRNVCREAAS